MTGMIIISETTFQDYLETHKLRQSIYDSDILITWFDFFNRQKSLNLWHQVKLRSGTTGTTIIFRIFSY